MMLHIPGVTDAGIQVEQLTEFVDLFPTLVEAAGLEKLEKCPKDSSNIAVCSEGESLMPLVSNPDLPTWKKRVFSQYPRKEHSKRKMVMGYSMRTPRYRYTEWVHFETAPHFKPKWDRVYGVELYDHQIDPEENHNVASDDAYKVIVAGLSKQLHQGWRKA